MTGSASPSRSNTDFTDSGRDGSTMSTAWSDEDAVSIAQCRFHYEK
jgi:hypothetical protein